MDEYIGTIKICPFNYVPEDYLKCDGQMLRINEYNDLFEVIGNAYGGDGKQTFQLPDLCGRAIVGSGKHPNLSLRNPGDYGGSETVKLELKNIPPHTHIYNALSGSRESQDPAFNFLGAAGGNFYSRKDVTDELIAMNSNVVQPAGYGEAHENMPPFLTLTYIICYFGVFPLSE